ncbi:MAG TPA: T9SS type A sorting domain-containing protein [Flavisolibacter sp.]
MRKLFFTLLSVTFFVTSQAQVGNLDSTFGTNGIKTLDEPMDMTGFELLKSFPAEKGGRYDVYGITYFSDGPLFIAKYLADNSLDVTYGNNGISEGVTMNLRAVVRQEDGRITAAGVVENEYGTPHYDLVMVRFHTDGSIDQKIKVGTIGSQYEDVQSLTVQDNKVILSGVSASVWIGTYYFVKILYPDGAIWEYSSTLFNNSAVDYAEENVHYHYEGLEDPFGKGFKVAWEAGGVVLEGPLGYLHTEYQEDNNIFHTYTIEYATARFLADGSRDKNFGENGTLPVGNYTFPAFTDLYTLKTGASKKVVLATVLNNSTGNQDFSVTVYKEDETIDESFGNRGTMTLDFGGDDMPTAYVWQGSDLIVGGITTTPTGRSTALVLARFNSNGTLDPAFNETGKKLIARSDLVFTLRHLQLQKRAAKNTLLAVGEDLVAAIILEDDTELACTQDKEMPVLVGGSTVLVTGIDPQFTPVAGNARASYTLTGATIASGTGTASGISFNKGITTVTYKVAGLVTQSCSFTVAVYDPGAALPVKLVNFDGRFLSTGSVELTWKTATEENNAYFVIERLDDKSQFTEIGRVAATGVGSAYTFHDNKPEKGINTYRLRQVDANGKFAYSTAISVTIIIRQGMVLSPNPSNGPVTVTTKAPAAGKQWVQVFTINGRPVYSREHAGNQFTLDLSGLPNGIYLLRAGKEQTRLLIAR